MPVSHHEGRGWVAERLAATRPSLVIDVGPGEGIYSMLMRPYTPGARWECVEIWEPYVDEFDLTAKYDQVHVGDVRDFAFPDSGYTALLGDVVEHLPEPDGRRLLADLKQRADHLMVSVPIVHIEQGAVHGNPHEAHLYHWSWEEMDELMDRCDAFRGDVLGRWWWSR
ncbi:MULTISPECIES: class I SAM-dependent methyltransferase [unclassified Streptomyces]|uniref:class I SAM-dependent methyltransferase n=1 Tax=unclassified Streptomyces TaxID=2593676 RepID=UPI0014881CD4|nr:MULTISPECIES: class I SAM-dependent methyltransferase [unclassified Streptomyces]